jgi:hypothetical protein
MIKIHFGRKEYAEKSYRFNPIMELLKFSYLNLNIFKVVQTIWIVVLLDRVL